MNKELLISEIVSIEHGFFKSTKSIGGPASCQSQGGTFILARTGYWNLYPKEILESYLIDLKEAMKEKKNLVTLKYAYMMESTSPLEFEKIKDRLPIISQKKKNIVESIVFINMFWEEEVKNKYKDLGDRNRPLYSKEDTLTSVSVETYLRGELLTYSERTLELIIEFYKKCFDEKINLVYKNLSFLKDGKRNNTIENKENKCEIQEEKKELKIIDDKNSEILRKLAIKNAKELNVPITVTILDKTGNIKLVQKMDGAILVSVEISKNKALTAFYLNEKTFNLYKNSDIETINLQEINGFNLCFLGGGSPIRNKEELIGAIGISGGSVEEDMTILDRTLNDFYNL